MSLSKPTQYEASPSTWRSRKDRLLGAGNFIATKLRRVLESLTGQGFTTAVNLLYGLLCVRLLSVEGYAKFSLMFAFQASLSILMDVGTTSTLAPLVGERIDDLQLIADYVASLRQLSVRLFSFLAPATAIVFPLVVRKQHWGFESVAFLISMQLVFVWFARARGAYGAILILRRDRAAWYKYPMIASAAALLLLILAWATHVLNEYLAIAISVGANIYVAACYYFRSHRLLAIKGEPSANKRQAILRLIIPTVPNLVFIAIQGQISLMLITIFGRTSGIATVGALTRLVQIFLLFSQINPVLIEPYFAKLPAAKLKLNYIVTLLAAAGLGCGTVALAYFWPGLFLWVLGPKYAQMKTEVVLVMILGAIYYLSGLLFCMNTARRFVYWWSNITIIVSTLAVQTLFIWKADLGTVHTVLIFNICSNLVTLIVTISCGMYGFMRGPRRIHAV